MQTRTCILALVVVFAAAMRIYSHYIGHFWNFTPVGAMALFGGAYFSDRRLAYGVPLLAMALSDCFIGFPAQHTLLGISVAEQALVYACFVLTVLLGRSLGQNVTVLRTAGTAFSSAALFFLVTNLGVWLMGGGYNFPRTFEGLVATYTVAIPFFKGTLTGNFVYVAIFFGGFELAQRQFPALRQPVAATA
jgi:hypothetical protein